jgi:hypothetical protein
MGGGEPPAAISNDAAAMPPPPAIDTESRKLNEAPGVKSTALTNGLLARNNDFDGDRLNVTGSGSFKPGNDEFANAM